MQASNIMVHWFEMQNEYYLFRERYKPSNIFGKTRVKQNISVDVVQTHAFLVSFTNLNQIGPFSATVPDKLRDEACTPFRDNSQTSCQRYEQGLHKSGMHI